ncbi:hypothetical protein ACFTZI_20740 [Streptomyces decoyicus]|uniref:hypothetical protein n=1 Tax=Streptomyces decoyicus TaxID=249567 RepID=UPI00363724F3
MPAARKTAASKNTAAEAEATKKPTKFVHAGIDFEVPEPKQLPLKLLFADDELEAVKLIIGEEKWEAYLATLPTIGDFQELARKVNESSAGSGN